MKKYKRYPENNFSTEEVEKALQQVPKSLSYLRKGTTAQDHNTKRAFEKIGLDRWQEIKYSGA